MKWLVYTLAVVVFIFHQDFWNFARPDPLVFGFLPITAAYHAGYSILCAVLMWLLVTFAWPKHLEKYEDLPPRPGAQQQQGGH
jgi:hypothetical protein